MADVWFEIHAKTRTTQGLINRFSDTMSSKKMKVNLTIL